MTVISVPNSNSSFRKPYLSRNKNVNVSAIVIRVPAHKGTLQVAKQEHKKLSVIRINAGLKLYTHVLFDNK